METAFPSRARIERRFNAKNDVAAADRGAVNRV